MLIITEKKKYLNDIVNYDKISPLTNKLEVFRARDTSVINLKNENSQNYNLLQYFEKLKEQRQTALSFKKF